MGYRSIAISVSLLVLLTLSGEPTALYAATPIKAVPVASGFVNPLFVTSPPADTSRLFVVEKRGIIRIIKNGTVFPQPFLNCSTLVKSDATEQGLLGLAFHPYYKRNRYFYVDYTRQTDGATIVSRFETSADNPDSAVLSSQTVLLTVDQPYANHNGGMLAFGPDDRYLYIGLGDGGSAGDPDNNAQDSTTLLGKILRIDVDKQANKLIPPSNPFVDRPGWRAEIWAYGLRNPWRFSFDRRTGDLYIGDVGQADWEEVDFQPGGSLGGQNYGWRLKEGTHCYNPSTDCNSGQTLVDPIYDYDHTVGCSIAGGYVYRGCAIPDLQGTYFFGDFCNGQIWSLTYDGSTAVVQNRSAELNLGAILLPSFGEDARGELYIVDFGGTIYKIVPDAAPVQCTSVSCCVGTAGNVDGSGVVDLADLNLLITYLVGNRGHYLPCVDEANVDQTGIIDLVDLSFLLSYLMGRLPSLPACKY